MQTGENSTLTTKCFSFQAHIHVHRSSSPLSANTRFPVPLTGQNRYVIDKNKKQGVWQYTNLFFHRSVCVHVSVQFSKMKAFMSLVESIWIWKEISN